MSIEELVISYGFIDCKFAEKENSNLESFIPNEDELDDIFIEPVRRMKLVN